jgi:hypothetical protein
MHLRRAPGGFLGVHGDLFAHGSHDDNVGVLSFLHEQLLDLLTNLTIGLLDVVLGVAGVIHEGKETVISHINLEGR